MRIGILTLPFNNNYGGYLQCYALMQVVKRMGHEVVLINRRPQSNRFLGVKFFKGFIKKYVLRRNFVVYSKATMEKEYSQKGINILPFVNAHIIPKSSPIYNKRDYNCLKHLALDAVIVGSDQVWRSIYVPNIEEFFLDFAKDWNIQRIAYAASFGSDMPEYTDMQKQNCAVLLQKFDAISVREKSGIKVLRAYFGYNLNEVNVVLDPTMLLTKEYYISVFQLENKKSNNIFCYLLDLSDEKLKFVEMFSHSMDKKIHFFCGGDLKESLPSLESWIKGIYYSDLVITDSFHGTVFAILFNKPFYAIANHKRGNSRITDLLDRFGLESRMIDLNDLRNVRSIDMSIDWAYVNLCLRDQRDKSMLFLQEALK